MRANALEKLKAALELGLAMRHAQKAYFKDRKNSDLEEARRLEREYDAAALEASKALSGQPIQGDLLPVEPSLPPPPESRRWGFENGYGGRKS